MEKINLCGEKEDMNNNSSIYKELNIEDLDKIIKLNFGEDKYEANLISGGLFNTTYYVKIINLNKEIILRVGPVNKHLLLPFENFLMESEEQVYKLCKNNFIPCAKIIKCDTSNDIINRHYMILEYISSIPLCEIKNICNEEKNAIYEELGIHIANLHKLTEKQFGRVNDVLNGKGFDSWNRFLYNEILSFKKKFLEHNIFTEKDFKLIEKIFHNHKQNLDYIKIPHLIHGDLWEGNILIECVNEKFKITAIIDVDRAIFGDTEFEFANSWISNNTFFKAYGIKSENNKSEEIRKKIYKLIYSLIDTYVWSVEYNNKELGEENKKKCIMLISELIVE